MYSIYINNIPRLLHPCPIIDGLDSIHLASLMICLLYTDDVVLIADKYKMGELLQLCERHSLELDFRWNPNKCVILDVSPQLLQYSLHGITI